MSSHDLSLGLNVRVGVGLLCPECNMLLRDAVQTADGTRLCEPCYETIFNYPDCKSPKTGIKVTDEYFCDRAVRREISQLDVTCKNSGCTWTGPLGYYQTNHEGECELMPVQCPNRHKGCEELIGPSDGEHATKSCMYRDVTCRYCGQDTMPILMNDHKQTCPGYPDESKLEETKELADCHTRSCTQRVKGALESVHGRGNFVWSKVELAASTSSQFFEKVVESYLEPIPHEARPSPSTTDAYLGFSEFMLRTIDWSDYDSVGHVQSFLRALEAITEIDLTQEIGVVEELSDLLKPVEQERNSGLLQTATPGLFLAQRSPSPQSLESVSSEIGGDVLNNLPQQAVDAQQGSVHSSLPLSHQQLPVQVVSTDREVRPERRVQRIEKNQLEELEKQMHMLKMRILQHEELERQMSVHVSELKVQLQASLASTHNGSFLWRIPEMSRRRRNAIDGRITSIYSPPFYTGRNGYKMCMRVYLNGDGTGHKTHVSLFFVLMRREFDALLKWPFEHKVSLILIDQNHHKHIVQTFKPTAESSSFRRPISDMNVASGCPQFAKLSVLDDPSYVMDDTVYFKCIVDTSNIFHP